VPRQCRGRSPNGAPLATTTGCSTRWLEPLVRLREQAPVQVQPSVREQAQPSELARVLEQARLSVLVPVLE